MSALLEVDQLEVNFGGRVSAVRGASVTVERGETHCLVGESGCGKSVTALAVMNLLAANAVRRAARLSLQGEDLLSLSDRGMARLRGNAMAMIFQEPMTSLNPAYTVGSQMTEVLPNIASHLVVVATLEIALAILLEAALSFLGLGVPPPLPSWGLMIAEAKDYMFFSPWVIMIPGAALFVLVLGINLLGDGLRDMFGARSDA